MQLLLIEDDVNLGQLIARGLTAYGYSVLWECEGDAGYERAVQGCHDLIVLDLMLPGLSGLELLGAIREQRITCPVLILTAMGSVSDRVRGLDGGADDYLTKPFAFDELLARLRALVRRVCGIVPGAELSCGNLRMVPSQHTVHVRDRLVDVPPREFALLEYLLHNEGRTLTRSQILARVWADPESVRANVADATASRLRRRLADAGWNGSIRAVIGIGYRLMDRPQLAETRSAPALLKKG